MFSKFLTKAINLFSHSTSLIILAIIIGSVIGIVSPNTGELAGNNIDPTILVLVFLLLFELPVKGVFKSAINVRFIAIAWFCNFILIPLIGFAVASLFLSGQTLFYTGLLIYFMAPCTDWYLGFTRLAKGNVELGAALLPINMISQLVLFPVYLLVFDTVVTYKIDLSVLIQWFLQPLLAAIILRFCLSRYIEKLLPICKALIPIVLTLLVGQIFAANIYQLTAHLAMVPVMLLAIFVFFVLTYFLAEGVAKLTGLNYPEHCLLAFTTGARNAPLMLGITTTALPEQPLIYATITIGMLIEFPHLTVLKTVFIHRLNKGDLEKSNHFSQHTQPQK